MSTPMNDKNEQGLRVSAGLLDILADAAMFVLRFDRPADKQLSDYFRANPKLGHTERGFIAETIYAGLRHKRMLDAVLEEMRALHPVGVQSPHAFARRFVIATLLRTRNFNVRELESVVRREEREELSAYKSVLRGELPFAIATELPDWVLDRLKPQYEEMEIRALAQALQQPAPLDLRVNLLKTDRKTAQHELEAQGILTTFTPFAPEGLRVEGKPALQRNPLFLSGGIEVQDEGSQLLAHLLAPKRGEMVGDFCAGAGGKTLALSALMRSTGRLYAFDVSDKRLAKLKPRLARSGASNIDTRLIASERDPKLGRLAGKLDRVLVDAPCSGLGTLRRNPDLKWRQQEEALLELNTKQVAILRAAAKLVKVGGRLVYATCSVLPEENETVVREFLQEHPAFRVVPAIDILRAQQIEVPHWGAEDGLLRLMPHIHGTDGFFAAVLERQAVDSKGAP